MLSTSLFVSIFKATKLPTKLNWQHKYGVRFNYIHIIRELLYCILVCEQKAEVQILLKKVTKIINE